MSDHSPSNACPKCGADLPSAATSGLCPRCLMAEAMTPTKLDTAPSSSAKMLTPAELAPHFPQLEILECLGRGGMGVVYKARQKTLNRLVALKLLAPERVTDAKFAERFTHEAQALAALNHPSIVTIYDFGQAGGFYYLLMEFVDGVNLRQAMKAGRFTPEQALAVVPPVCEALQYAHDHGIVHRDIKPENLLLDKEGRVKIADFGIAKILGAPASAADGTEEAAPGAVGASDRAPASQSEPTLASLAGTPQYMAPEQKAHRATDHRADIYSLGVVLYELLTGELPADKLQPPSRKVQIDVRLDEIVLRALEKSPELRYQTAGEFRTQVETMTSRPPENVASAAAVNSSGTPEEEESDDGTSLITRSWQAVPLVAVILAFFNPWGGRAWYWFAAGCAMLAVLPAFGLSRRKRKSARVSDGPAVHNASAAAAPSRFSRTAIVGACWLGWGVLAALWLRSIQGQPVGGWRSMTGPDKLGFIITEAGLIGGFLSVLGTTILGWIAVTQIRRSAGKLRGLGLAVFGGLFFPLLMLDVLIAYSCGWLIQRMVTAHSIDHVKALVTSDTQNAVQMIGQLQQNMASTSLVVSLGVMLIVDFLIIRAVWRAVNGAAGKRSSDSATVVAAGDEMPEPRFSTAAIIGAAWMPFAVGATIFWASLGTPFRHFNLGAALAIFVSLSGYFGSTLLGWVAVSQIRRSAGRVHGMWLAVFDGLVFPLLALNVAIWLAVGNLWRANPPRYGTAFGKFLLENEAIIPLSALLFCIAMDFFFIRAVWRAVNRHEPAGESRTLNGDEPSSCAKSTSPLLRYLLASFWTCAAIVLLIGMRVARTQPLMYSFFGSGGWFSPATYYLFVAVCFAIAVGCLFAPALRRRANYLLNGIALLAVIAGILLGVKFSAAYFASGLRAVEDTSQTVAFGPVIERVLPFDRSFIDFQSGSVMRPDLEKFGVSGADWEPWIQQTGADAMVEEAPEQRIVQPPPSENGFPRLVSISSDLPERRGDRESCVFVSEETDDFDSVRPIDADSRLKIVTERDLYWGFASGSRPWWFKTHDGAKGVLQIVGTSDNPRGLKIRYKLLVPEVAIAREHSRFPHSAHISRGDHSVMVSQDDADVHYVFYTEGDFGTNTDVSQNTRSVAWVDRGSLLLTGGNTVGYYRESVFPDALSVNGREFDLRRGRVLAVHGDGTVEQLRIFPTRAAANAPEEIAKLVTAAREMAAEPITIEKLLLQLETAESQLRDLLKGYAPTHSMVVEVRALIETLKKKIGEKAGLPVGAVTEFGPVMEREIKAAIDLDSGREGAIPESAGQKPRSGDVASQVIGNTLNAVSWMEREGMDVVAHGPDSFLSGFGMRFIAQDNAQWDQLTAAQVVTVLAASDARHETYARLVTEEKRTTLVFQTRQGGKGVLQFLGANDDDSVRIRYKLVQAPVGSAADSPKPGRAVLDAELQQARAVAAKKEAGLKAGIIGADEYESAKDDVLVLEARLTGDELQIAEVRLDAARRRLESATTARAAGVLSAEEYEQAKGKVSVAKAELHEVRVKAKAYKPIPADAVVLMDALQTIVEKSATHLDDPAELVALNDERLAKQKEMRALIVGTEVEPLMDRVVEISNELSETGEVKDLARREELNKESKALEKKIWVTIHHAVPTTGELSVPVRYMEAAHAWELSLASHPDARAALIRIDDEHNTVVLKAGSPGVADLRKTLSENDRRAASIVLNCTLVEVAFGAPKEKGRIISRPVIHMLEGRPIPFTHDLSDGRRIRFDIAVGKIIRAEADGPAIFEFTGDVTETRFNKDMPETRFNRTGRAARKIPLPQVRVTAGEEWDFIHQIEPGYDLRLYITPTLSAEPQLMLAMDAATVSVAPNASPEELQRLLETWGTRQFFPILTEKEKSGIPAAILGTAQEPAKLVGHNLTYSVPVWPVVEGDSVRFTVNVLAKNLFATDGNGDKPRTEKHTVKLGAVEAFELRETDGKLHDMLIVRFSKVDADMPAMPRRTLKPIVPGSSRSTTPSSPAVGAPVQQPPVATPATEDGELLERQVQGSRPVLEGAIRAREKELAELLSVLGEKHPKIVERREAIARLQETLAKAKPADDAKVPIKIGDIISMTILEDQTGPVSLRVQPSGEVEFPLIGRMKAAGKMTSELEKEVAGILKKDHFRQATVVISLSEIAATGSKDGVTNSGARPAFKPIPPEAVAILDSIKVLMDSAAKQGDDPGALGAIHAECERKRKDLVLLLRGTEAQALTDRGEKLAGELADTATAPDPVRREAINKECKELEKRLWALTHPAGKGSAETVRASLPTREPRLQFRIVADTSDADSEAVDGRDGKQQFRLRREVLLDDAAVADAKVSGTGEATQIDVTFTDAGGKRFAEITGANVGKQLAIVFDGKVLSAPTLQSAIPGGRAQITGRFTAGEAEAMAKALASPYADKAAKPIPQAAATIMEAMKALPESYGGRLADPETMAAFRKEAAAKFGEVTGLLRGTEAQPFMDRLAGLNRELSDAVKAKDVKRREKLESEIATLDEKIWMLVHQAASKNGQPVDPVPAIELKVAQQQLEKTLADVLEAQATLAARRLEMKETHPAVIELKEKLNTLEQKAERLRAIIRQGALKQ